MIWVKVEKSSIQEDIIFLPQSIVLQLQSQVYVCFGQKRIRTQVRALPSFIETGGETFDKPQKIKMTSSLWQKILMVHPINLQMMISNGNINFGPVIGLLDNKTYDSSITNFKRPSIRFDIYPQIGGLIYFFSIKSIDWQKKSAYGRYFNYSKWEWEYGEFPLPAAVYAQCFNIQKKAGLKRLIKATGGKVFNSEWLSKWGIYKRIKDDEGIKEFIPETKLVKQFSDIREFLNKHQKVLIKPLRGMSGRGIWIIEKIGDDCEKFKVRDYRFSKTEETYTLSSEELETSLEKEGYFKTYHLVQPLLSLAKVNGGSFDLRVMMQKDEKGEWAHSGTECRVARSEMLVTNIARGAYVLSLREALQQSFGIDVDVKSIEKQIFDLCYQFCGVMDQSGEHYGEFGIDVAIDIRKKLWFIEANIKPCFNGFRKLDNEAFLRICYRPLLYATHLGGFGRKED